MKGGRSTASSPSRCQRKPTDTVRKSGFKRFQYGAEAVVVTHFSADHLLVAPSVVGLRASVWSCSSRQDEGTVVLGFSRNVRVRLPGPPTSPPSVISVQHCRRANKGKGWTVHAGHRLMGGAAQQAGQHYRQRLRGGQPRHRACAYRARPSCTHLV